MDTTIHSSDGCSPIWYNSEVKASYNLLPDEIIQKIFCYVDDITSYAQSSRVCKQWKDVSEDAYVITRLACLYHFHKEKIEYKVVKYLYKKAAEKEYRHALYILGSMYFEGEGVKKDHKQAFDLFHRALQAGHIKTVYKLGYCYLFGYGTPVNYRLAKKYLEQSKEQGEARGMYYLAKIYHEGLGVEKNMDQAVDLLRSAADKDDISACYQLGSIYIQQNNIDQAVRYLEIASDRNHPKAINLLGITYYCDYHDRIKPLELWQRLLDLNLEDKEEYNTACQFIDAAITDLSFEHTHNVINPYHKLLIACRKRCNEIEKAESDIFSSKR